MLTAESECATVTRAPTFRGVHGGGIRPGSPSSAPDHRPWRVVVEVPPKRIAIGWAFDRVPYPREMDVCMGVGLSLGLREMRRRHREERSAR